MLIRLRKSNETTGKRQRNRTGTNLVIVMTRQRTGKGREIRLRLNKIVDERVVKICELKNWPVTQYIQAVISEQSMIDFNNLFGRSVASRGLGGSDEMDTGKLRKIVKELLDKNGKHNGTNGEG